MQDELATEFASYPIAILAINEEGYERGNSDIVALGDLPVMQDSSSTNVWTDWAAEWRDVVILDADNVEVYRFNLHTYDLGNPVEYEHLKAVFVAVAEGAPIPAGP